MSKHLTLSDGVIIEKYLAQDMPFSYIAKRLHRSPSTISREVRNHRCFVNGYRYSDNPCINYRSCIRRNLCVQESIYSCYHKCKNCTEFNCNELCSQFVSFNCEALSKPPYVCTGCPDEKKCKRNHAYYTAHRAHAEYGKQLHDARASIRTSPEQLMELNDLLMPLVNKGPSINHIFASHAEEIGLSEKTIYNHIDQHAFHIRNIDLPKKVRYRQRQNRPHEVLMKMDYKCRQGRTYTDFTSYMEQNPKLSIIEMDTVIGARGSGNVLLTMLSCVFIALSNFTIFLNSKDISSCKSILQISRNILLILSSFTDHPLIVASISIVARVFKPTIAAIKKPPFNIKF